MERTEVIDFHQTVDLGGIRVTPYRAGHVLGAAMFLVEIGGMRLLYTGQQRSAQRAERAWGTCAGHVYWARVLGTVLGVCGKARGSTGCAARGGAA
jgi:hypothetical protein